MMTIGYNIKIRTMKIHPETKADLFVVLLMLTVISLLCIKKIL
jgi:hypothetical protein